MGVDISARLVYGYKLDSTKYNIIRESLDVLENSPCDIVFADCYCDPEDSDLYFGISYDNVITGAGLLEVEKVRKQEIIDLMVEMFGFYWAEFLDKNQGLDPEFHLFAEIW